MPSTGELASLSNATSTTRPRRRSRTVPILIILGVSLLTFICIVTPLRYFDTGEPPTRLSSHVELTTTTTPSDRVDRNHERVVVVQSPDSVEPLVREAMSGGQVFDHLALPLRDSPRFERAVGQLVDTVGDLVLSLFGFEEQDWFDFTHEGLTRDEEDQMRQLGIEPFHGGPSGRGVGIDGSRGETGGGLTGNGLSSWSESSLYVERTQSLHPSRPSAFGPHLLEKPLRGFLYPVSLFASSSYGCSLPTTTDSTFTPPPFTNARSSIAEVSIDEEGEEEWIALVQRGDCPFSTKVRIAQELGASAVVFGDEDEENGGIKGGKGLLTPWSPDDTKDIKIPSIFVSRASYLSLIKTWQDEQRIVLRGHDSNQIDLEIKGYHLESYVGLEVVLSKDEMFAWPLLDLLFLLLFLPSLLTLLTVFTQRVRMARAQKAERAPKSAVAKLVVFKWGEPSPEKVTPSTARGNPEGQDAPVPSTSVSSTAEPTAGDEEREIGLTLQPRHEDVFDESTSLLRPVGATSTSATAESAAPSLVSRLRACLPRRMSNLLPRRRSSLSHSLGSAGSSSSSSLPLRGPNPRYPSLTDCSICLDSFVVNESIVIELPCSHLFHRDCAMSWLLTRKGVCPICRKSVMEDNNDETPPSTTTTMPPSAIRDGDGQ